MTQPTPPAEHHQPLLALTAAETDAITKAALFWFVGEGAMDGSTYEALHNAMKKLFLEPAAEVKP